MNGLLSIKKAAERLAVNVQTLRRWDTSGRLVAKRKKTGLVSRYIYDENDLEDFLSADFRALHKVARTWAYGKAPFELPRRFYCPDRSIFKARLSRFELDLSKVSKLKETFPLIVAVTGEIGNNSYDHNLGNWPDVPGASFGYIINERKVILADRGLGVLKTLQRIRPELSDHTEALYVAFTELLSGRAPEARGNGLKYVREIVTNYGFNLFFQSGDAVLKLGKRNKDLIIKKTKKIISGTFAILSY